MDTTTPTATRPYIPGYGIPEHTEGMLDWQHVMDRLAAARNYWIDTADRAGRVHATPIWGGVVDGALYVEGSAETRRGRNMAENPNIVAHLESGDDVVIVEGTVEQVGKPHPDLAARLVETLESKYGASDYHPSADQWNEGGLYRVRPLRVFAWTHFPDDTTRFTFEG